MKKGSFIVWLNRKKPKTITLSPKGQMIAANRFIGSLVEKDRRVTKAEFAEKLPFFGPRELDAAKETLELRFLYKALVYSRHLGLIDEIVNRTKKYLVAPFFFETTLRFAEVARQSYELKTVKNYLWSRDSLATMLRGAKKVAILGPLGPSDTSEFLAGYEDCDTVIFVGRSDRYFQQKLFSEGASFYFMLGGSKCETWSADAVFPISGFILKDQADFLRYSGYLHRSSTNFSYLDYYSDLSTLFVPNTLQLIILYAESRRVNCRFLLDGFDGRTWKERDSSYLPGILPSMSQFDRWSKSVFYGHDPIRNYKVIKTISSSSRYSLCPDLAALVEIGEKQFLNEAVMGDG